jgi:EmrB/QacA subfamily drug resistance transporter
MHDRRGVRGTRALQSAHDERGQGAGGFSGWPLVALLSLAQLMVILDISAVNVALPSMATDLRIGHGELSWTIISYSLVFGSLLLLGGRAADLLGRRRVFLVGLAVFIGASLVSALADSPAVLFAARAGQGLGAAMLSPAALSIITTRFSGAERARALGVWGAIGGVGAAVGVLVGGALTQLVDWRAIFLINLPIGLVVAAGVVHRLAADEVRADWRRLDVRGAVLVTAGVAAVVLALSRAQSAGWVSVQTLGLLAGGLALLAAFAVVERRVSLPLLRVERLRDRAIGGGFVMMLAASAVLFGSFLLCSLYLQQVLGADPIETGLAFLPFALAIGAGVHAATRVVASRGVRGPLAAGFIVAAAGLFLLARVRPDGSYAADLLPGMLIAGVGVGVLLVSVAFSILAGAPPDESGMLSGLNTTGHEVGGSLGLAVLTTIATSPLAHAREPAAIAVSHGIAHAFLAAGIIATIAGLAAAALLPTARSFLPRLELARPIAIH